MKSEVEEWRDIEEFPGYQVSNLGRVKSLDRWSSTTASTRGRHVGEKILRSGSNGIVSLARYDKKGTCIAQQSKSVGILVLEAFVEPRPTGYLVLHLDDDLTNNKVSNLKFVSRNEHKAVDKALGRIPRGQYMNRSKLTWQQVQEIRTKYAEGVSGTALAEQYKIGRTATYYIIRNKTWGNSEPVAPNVRAKTKRIFLHNTDLIDLPNEKWHDIATCFYYQVSNLGHVRVLERTLVTKSGRLRNFPAKMLKPATSTSGHLTIGLPQEKTNIAAPRRVPLTVHSLVAGAFIGPRPPGQEIRHLDGNPTNNVVENLAYGTRKAPMMATNSPRSIERETP